MTDPKPWFADEASGACDARQHAPATSRNRDAILSILKTELPDRAKLLEIASGSGEHARYFTSAMPNILWQPSDSSTGAIASISAWRAYGDVLPNFLPPVKLDVSRKGDWPLQSYDAIFVANLTHIAPFDATAALFACAWECLKCTGKLIIYGPFFRDGSSPSAGDISFDAALRARNAAYGLRHIDEIDDAAKANGLDRVASHEMPANNLTLVYTLAEDRRSD